MLPARSALLLLALMTLLSLPGIAQVDDSYYTYPDSVRTEVDSTRSVLINVPPPRTAEEIYRSGSDAYRLGDCALATREFEEYTSMHAMGDSIPWAYYLLARCAERGLDSNRAEGYLRYAEQYADAGLRPHLIGASLPYARRGSDPWRVVSLLVASEEYARGSEAIFKLRNEELQVSVRAGALDSVVRYAKRVIEVPGVAANRLAFARFQLAHSLFGLAHYDEAYGAFKSLADLIPKQEEAAEARYRMVEIDFIQDDHEAVKRDVLRAAGTNTPHQYWVAKGYLLLARSLVKRNDIMEAKNVVRSLLNRYPNETDGIYKEASDAYMALSEGKKSW